MVNKMENELLPIGWVVFTTIGSHMSSNYVSIKCGSRWQKCQCCPKNSLPDALIGKNNREAAMMDHSKGDYLHLPTVA
jgi:hypothetical protein